LTELRRTTPGGPAAFEVFAAVAEFERNVIRERSRPNALSRP
jgi:DNA invertase Pin-like site-specific DNA recombinase